MGRLLRLLDDIIVVGIIVFLIVLPISVGFAVYNFLNPGNSFWERLVAFIVAVFITFLMGGVELILLAIISSS